MIFRIIILNAALAFCQDLNQAGEPNRAMNLRRRESIPLHQFHTVSPVIQRRWNRDDDVNYRRTRDILIERNKYELPPGLDPLMVNIVQQKEPGRMETSMNQRELTQEEKKQQLDKFRRELRWLTVHTDDGIGIGI